MGKGTDYGMGRTNIDRETGIRYGVISSAEVCQAWADSSEEDYEEPTCPKCGNRAADYDDETHGGYGCKGGCVDYACDDCEYAFDSSNAYGDEPSGSWTLDDGEYIATQSRDDCDIFVTRSPYFTRAAFCSPCAPGACYLMTPDEDGERCYCFGHDWFESGTAPYPVYSVATGELVTP